VWRYRAEIRREWLEVLLLSLSGMALVGVGPFFAARTTNAANMGLIFTCAPLAIALCTRFFTHERMSRVQATGIVIGFLGVLTIISHGDPDVILGLRFVAGDLWMLMAAAGWVVYSLLLKGRPSLLPDTVRLFACSMGGALLILPLTVGEAIVVQPTYLDLRILAAMLFAALVPSFLAYRLHAYTTAVLGTGRTAVFSYLAPLFGVFFAWLILGEPVLAHHWIGGAAILSGVWLTSRPKRAA
jgi:drug/metabolite transporter (DMT)-like permease